MIGPGEDKDEDPREENSEEVSEQRKRDNMRAKYPGYRNEAYNAAAFIGQDYPYVPGDD